jgi:hypothetical protein
LHDALQLAVSCVANNSWLLLLLLKHSLCLFLQLLQLQLHAAENI